MKRKGNDAASRADADAFHRLREGGLELAAMPGMVGRRFSAEELSPADYGTTKSAKFRL